MAEKRIKLSNAISKLYSELFHHIKNSDIDEAVLYGGRGTYKSSSMAGISAYTCYKEEVPIAYIVRTKSSISRKIGKPIKAAIKRLGLEDAFEYVPSTNTIHLLASKDKDGTDIRKVKRNRKDYKEFRTGVGIDLYGCWSLQDAENIKSSMPEDKYYRLIVFEEFSNFDNLELINSLLETFVRGGNDQIAIFVTNTPRTKYHIVYKEYIEKEVEGRYVLKTTYLDAIKFNRSWIGESFIKRADKIKLINPKYFQWAYMGDAVGEDGAVFNNIEFLDYNEFESEIKHRSWGMDYGRGVDPNTLVGSYLDEETDTLYITDELWMEGKWLARDMYSRVMEFIGDSYYGEIVGDSASEKIDELAALGLNIRGCYKGPGSRLKGYTWIANRARVVVDPHRCPKITSELMKMEFRKNKLGRYIEAIDDGDDHGIDALRYQYDELYLNETNGATMINLMY